MIVDLIELPALAYFLIPSTNKAKDMGMESRFKLLHSVSVILTLVLLISNALVLSIL